MATPKQQFNTYLPADLIRAAKHAAIDEGQTLSRFVENALRAHLAQAPRPEVGQPALILQPVVFAADMNSSVAFYERLGFPTRARRRDGSWVELDAGPRARLAIHHREQHAEGAERVQLCMEADRPLRELAADLEAMDIVAPAGIVDESFGLSMVVHDADGLPVMIQWHDEDLYS